MEKAEWGISKVYKSILQCGKIVEMNVKGDDVVQNTARAAEMSVTTFNRRREPNV